MVKNNEGSELAISNLNTDLHSYNFTYGKASCENLLYRL